MSFGGKAFIAKEGDAVPPRRLATQAAKQLRALTHAGGAARAATALDRAPRTTSATVAIHIPSFCLLCEISTKKRTAVKILPKRKLCRILQATKYILVPKTDSKWKNLNFKSQIGENSNFELGQIRNSKITFDFSQ
jgi:hypothetical protein